MRGWRRLLALATATAVATVTLVAVPPLVDSEPEAATAADARDFDPGRIIDDAVFYAPGAMTTEQVQAFLAANGDQNSQTGQGAVFQFTAFDLDVRNFEGLQLDVLQPPNSAPTANADTLAATEDTPAVWAPSALLGNDTALADEIDALKRQLQME